MDDLIRSFLEANGEVGLASLGHALLRDVCWVQGMVGLLPGQLAHIIKLNLHLIQIN